MTSHAADSAASRAYGLLLSRLSELASHVFFCGPRRAPRDEPYEMLDSRAVLISPRKVGAPSEPPKAGTSDPSALLGGDKNEPKKREAMRGSSRAPAVVGRSAAFLWAMPPAAAEAVLSSFPCRLRKPFIASLDATHTHAGTSSSNPPLSAQRGVVKVSRSGFLLCAVFYVRFTRSSPCRGNEEKKRAQEVGRERERERQKKKA